VTNKLAVALVVAMTSLPGTALGAEMGFSIYPLGSTAFSAGVTPPPGFYVTPAVGYYSGKISGNVPIGGRLAVDLDVKFFSPALNILYVSPVEILGGYFGVSTNVPIGHVGLDAQAFVGPFSASRSVSGWGMGDMSMKTQLGWTSGSFSHTVYVMGWLPTGRYQTGFNPNIGLNRPAVDVGWGFTWLETNTQLEFSSNFGMTFNAINTATDYKTGNEFHAEWAIGKKFTPELTIGAVGYVYQQVTGDSGSGAVLGSFKGQSFGVGPGISYVTMLGGHVAIFNARYYHEFDVQRRFQGSMSFLTATVRF